MDPSCETKPIPPATTAEAAGRGNYAKQSQFAGPDYQGRRAGRLCETNPISGRGPARSRCDGRDNVQNKANLSRHDHEAARRDNYAKRSQFAGQDCQKAPLAKAIVQNEANCQRWACRAKQSQFGPSRQRRGLPGSQPLLPPGTIVQNEPNSRAGPTRRDWSPPPEPDTHASSESAGCRLTRRRHWLRIRKNERT